MSERLRRIREEEEERESGGYGYSRSHVGGERPSRPYRGGSVLGGLAKFLFLLIPLLVIAPLCIGCAGCTLCPAMSCLSCGMGCGGCGGCGGCAVAHYEEYFDYEISERYNSTLIKEESAYGSIGGQYLNYTIKQASYFGAYDREVVYNYEFT